MDIRTQKQNCQSWQFAMMLAIIFLFFSSRTQASGWVYANPVKPYYVVNCAYLFRAYDIYSHAVSGYPVYRFVVMGDGNTLPECVADLNSKVVDSAPAGWSANEHYYDNPTFSNPFISYDFHGLGTPPYGHFPAFVTGGYYSFSCPVFSSAYLDQMDTKCICTDPYVPNARRTACVQNNFIISLSGVSSVEPSNGSTIEVLTINATVVDQNTGLPPTTSVAVKVSLKVDSTSGGHDHGDSTRPRGDINGTKCETDDTCVTLSVGGPGSSGSASVNFKAPEASGTHTITATCDECSNTASKAVDVKVEGLATISDSVYYALIEDGSTTVIGTTEEHASNHYIASAAQLKLWELGENFYSFQIRNSVPTPTLLHLNDASLKWGGKFDIKGRWRGDHQEHMRGTVIDVRANSSPGAIPPGLFEHYIDIAANLGIDAHLEYIGHPVKQHFHMRLLNRRE